jgi:hypothetical protein
MNWEQIRAERDAFFASISAIATDSKKRKFTEIYWVYLKWATFNNREVIDRIAFSMVLEEKYKRHKKRGHSSYFYVDCELLNLKYEDKLALKEYIKEENKWRKQQRKKEQRQKKSRATRRKNKLLLKKENELSTPDLKSDSSQE